ncbi:MAG: hypothetical protein ACI4J5_06375 [Oscillospiraceae bacterium]
MFNIIKTELYRLVRMNSFYIMIFVSFGLAFLLMWLLTFDMTYMKTEFEKTDSGIVAETDDENSTEIGISMEANESWIDSDITLSSYLAAVTQSGVLLILLSIFSSMYVYAEQKNGYIKNIAGQLSFKGILGISKLVGIAVQVLTVSAAFFAGTVISGKIIFGDKFVVGDISLLLKFIGIELLLHFAYASLVSMLCILAGSSAFSITAGILMTSGIPMIIYSGINHLLHKSSFFANADVSRLGLDTQICNIEASIGSGELARPIITGIVYIVISAVISAAVIQKREIRNR